MNRTKALTLAVVLINPAFGESTPSDPAPIETFTGPKSIELTQPRYPEAPLHRNQEGWVHLNFMVDTEGKPYEITVADAVGDEDFQEAAIRALKQSTFEPAMLDGAPIDSGANYSYSFQLKGGRDGARPRFVLRYRKLIEAVQAGDRTAADELLARLDPDTLYESAYLEYGRYARHRAWGTVDQQIRALRRAIGRDESTRYLPESMMVDAMQRLYALQLRKQDFGGALMTARRLSSLPIEDGLRHNLERSVEKIQRLKEGDPTFAVEGSIDQGSYSWHLRLLRSRFHIDQVRGRLAEIKLRCSGKFVGFAYDEDLVYRVLDRFMPCSVEVVGDPGTRFRLIQSPSPVEPVRSNSEG